MSEKDILEKIEQLAAKLAKLESRLPDSTAQRFAPPLTRPQGLVSGGSGQFAGSIQEVLQQTDAKPEPTEATEPPKTRTHEDAITAAGSPDQPNVAPMPTATREASLEQRREMVTTNAQRKQEERHERRESRGQVVGGAAHERIEAARKQFDLQGFRQQQKLEGVAYQPGPAQVKHTQESPPPRPGERQPGTETQNLNTFATAVGTTMQVMVNELAQQAAFMQMLRDQVLKLQTSRRQRT